jgi:hypothetical protein
MIAQRRKGSITCPKLMLRSCAASCSLQVAGGESWRSALKAFRPQLAKYLQVNHQSAEKRYNRLCFFVNNDPTGPAANENGVCSKSLRAPEECSVRCNQEAYIGGKVSGDLAGLLCVHHGSATFAQCACVTRTALLVYHGEARGGRKPFRERRHIVAVHR